MISKIKDILRCYATGIPVSSWYDAIGDPTVADAILERIIHAAHQIELSGESVRKIKGSKSK